MTVRRGVAILLALAGCLGAFAVPASCQEFPSQVTVVVGFSPGGGDEGGGSSGRSAAARLQPQPGYDQTARLYARHFGKFLPGTPAATLRHLPGAGSMKAAEFIARDASADGSVLGVVSGEALIAPVIGTVKPAYALEDFAFVGARAASEYVCAVDGQSVPESAAISKDIPFAATTPGRRPHAHAVLFRALGGLPTKIVGGYRDGNEMLLALRRGEVAGFCGLPFENLRASIPNWIASGRLRPIMRLSPPWAERLSAVPRASALAKNHNFPDDEIAALDVLAYEGALAWTLIAPAAMPLERLALLRKAFAAMQADRAYLREATRRNLEIDPVSPTRLEEAARAFTQASPAVRAAIAKLNAAP